MMNVGLPSRQCWYTSLAASKGSEVLYLYGDMAGVRLQYLTNCLIRGNHFNKDISPLPTNH